MNFYFVYKIKHKIHLISLLQLCSISTLLEAQGFISAPGNVLYVVKGGDISMKWTFTEENLLQARWGKVNSINVFEKILLSKTANEPVTINDRNKVEYKNGEVVLLNAQPSDGGLYRCELNYDLDLPTTPINDTKLIVTDLNPLPVALSVQEVAEGEELTLSIDIAGYPEPLVKWYHDNTVVKDGSLDPVIIKRNGDNNDTYRVSLTISSVTYADHDGEYEARLEFPGMQVSIMETFNVKVKYSAGKSTQFVSNATNNIVREGSAVKLICSSNSYPTSTYRIIQADAIIANSSEYVISSMGLQNEMEYCCIPKNEIGEGDKKCMKPILGVPPAFTTENISKSMLTGESETLQFTVIGKPKPTIDFKFNGNSLHRTFEIEESVSTDASSASVVNISLRINDVSQQDHGVFTCIATNEVGHASSTVNLNVKYELHFAEEPTNQNLEMGGNLTLPCLARVNPGHVTYTWKFNEQDIPSYVGKSSGSLNLVSVTTNNTGAYTCIAANGSQTITATGNILVTKIPAITFISNDQTVIAGSYADFYCNATGLPNPVVSWKRKGSNTVIKEGTQFRFFANAEDAGVNTFQCEARNLAGSTRRETKVVVSDAAATDDTASWLIPLLISATLILLLIIVCCFLRKKWLKRKPVNKSTPVSEASTSYTDQVGGSPQMITQNKDKLVLNPMFTETDNKDSMYPVYLPNDFESNSMQILSIQRFQGQTLPWPGLEDNSKEEMSVEMSLDAEEDKYRTYNSNTNKMNSSYQNTAFESEENNLSEVNNTTERNKESNNLSPRLETEEQEIKLDLYDNDESNDVTQNVDQYVDDLFDFR